MIQITDDIEFIKKLPLDEQKEYLKAYAKADQLKLKNRVAGDFLEFIKYIWPEFIGGYHHKIISEKFYSHYLRGDGSTYKRLDKTEYHIKYIQS